MIKCERITYPPLRLIGKRSGGYPNWEDTREHDWFGTIEKSGTPAAVNDDSYCVLTRFTPDGMRCYLGEFFPAGKEAPDG
ncbi:MAG: hypothetical protein LBQ15_06360 [Clostridium sp.]|nr:hypothetical protein [Clostridium sp.]